ncbi:hypothetical protein CEXT_86631 [Caerostris extrusa]|uniref:Uncharacterized protein n=1 Tax=Caerostris extrusa TaxID=172846 RepID=A0AAV4N6T7_CAEEX|nr:hypothetical protein CEXT_86631 [Caerostris extrusa]
MTKATTCNLTFQAAVFNIRPFQPFLSQYLEDTLCPAPRRPGREEGGVIGFRYFREVGIFEPSLNSPPEKLAFPQNGMKLEDAHRSCFGISCKEESICLFF